MKIIPILLGNIIPYIQTTNQGFEHDTGSWEHFGDQIEDTGHKISSQFVSKGSIGSTDLKPRMRITPRHESGDGAYIF